MNEIFFHNIQPDAAASPAQKAWVVFSGQADVACLKILKPGFRHCFLLLHDGQKWLTVDPMLNHLDVCVHHQVSPEFDLPRWLCTQGQTVVPAAVNREHSRPAPVALFTCVEAVKRYLGLHRATILTPWQLYTHLRKQNDNKGDELWDL